MTTEATPTTTSHKPVIRYLGGTHYSVSSRTRAGHIHHVNTANLSCSCEAGRKGKRCWALALCVQYEAWRRNEEAKARAASRSTASAERASLQAANWSSTPAAVAQPLQATGGRRQATGQEQSTPAAAQTQSTTGSTPAPWHESAAYRALADAFGL